jgi:mannan endo-1,4-beta-mannosidase
MKNYFLHSILFFIILNTSTNLFAQRTTMYVSGRNLYSAASEKVILRGINEMYYALPDLSGSDETIEMAKTGANTIRISWNVRFRSSAADVVFLEKAVSNCIQNKMIPIVTTVDATGKFGLELDTCVDFWLRADVKALVNKHKKWFILNIANEAGDNNVTSDEFKIRYKAIIKKLRDAGIEVPLLIDGSGFGGNVEQLISCATEIAASDIKSNTFFSCHTYWNSNHESMIDNAISSIVNNNLPIIFGESPTPTSFNEGTKANPICRPSPYKYLLQKFNENEIGWLAWSWGKVKNDDCKIPDGRSLFDITVDGKYGNWLPNNPWATDVTINSPYSIQKTAVRPASFFSNMGGGSKAEAENGNNSGVINASSISGFSGNGYVDGTSFDNAGDNIKVVINVTNAGTFNLNIRYNGRFGEKYQDVFINGTSIGTIQFAASSQWATKTIPNINLNAGNNTIEIRKNWGWMDVDYVEAIGTNLNTNLKLEAETSSTLVGVQSASSIVGFSGAGYVEGSSFNDAGDVIKVFPQVNNQGSYTLSIRYNGRFGEKYQDVYVNNVFYAAVQFPASNGWATKLVGNINLNSGNNTVELRKNWGWMDVDFFEIKNTTLSKNALQDITKNTQLIKEAQLLINNTDANTILINATTIIGEKETAVAKLYTTDGKLLQQWSIGANQKKLSINKTLSTGIYVIQLMTKKAQFSKKIIVQ